MVVVFRWTSPVWDYAQKRWVMNRDEYSLTVGKSSTVWIIVTVLSSVSDIGSKLKLSLYRERLNVRAIDGSSTTNNSPS
jgi:hypothetical protein